ncbi:chromosome-associated protein H [Trypanosoma theileri]|uniref:Condensin complex subunit 2 n=1 Tax=Trypanosoma theileri TaxID=67003 RepID=A0A1X0NL14_9TRYP|nr:chromosome-associated protein H [Trypanosoma theileri]ORC85271.1 chromosome-associated protein H [Trypanosoma theileri]
MISTTKSEMSPQRQFLRRGEQNNTDFLPVEPSLVFDESRGVLIPPASQLGSPQPTQSISRQRRPRFATAQDLDDALLQAIEGKITRKNAWVSKDASNLLEGITHAVESTLDAATSTDEYSSFAKVATVVEGCSKVWTSRVDSTYQRSNQMVRRLLRNEDEDENGGGGGGAGSDNEDGTGENGSTAAAAAAAAERRKKAAQRRALNTRTLALDPSEINLDSKGRVALVHTGVNAQFRAITEKFDQGNSQGLLVHNTPLGKAGNLILDVDYAREVDREYSARRLRLSGGSRRLVKQEINLEENTETEGTTTTAMATEDMGELDHGINMPIQLPPFPPPVTPAASAGQSPVSAEEGGGRQSDHERRRPEEEEEAGRPSILLPSLLLLPHISSNVAGEDVNNTTTLGLMGTGEELDPEQQQQQQQQQQLRQDMTTDAGPLFPPHHPSDYDDNDWGGDGGGMDYGDDNYYDDEHTNTNTNTNTNNDDATSTTSNNHRNNGINGGVGENSDVSQNEVLHEGIATAAHQLVSGVAELNAMDGCLFGENRLALEAEDPTSWFPLSEPPTNMLLGGAAHKNSELLRLHKEHRFTQTGTTSQTTSTPATKRVKREKTIAFDLPGELAATSAAVTASGNVGTGDAADTSLSSLSFLLSGNVVDSSALKQSTTPGKNMTQLGKELLLGRSPNAVLAYTQGAFQRAKAQEAGLLLAEPPVPGKTIPSYLPHPITVTAFFQPFSTPLPQWNLLRKSATGRTFALHSSSAAPSRRASGVIGNNNNNDNNNNNNNNNRHQGNGWGSKLEDDTQSHMGEDDGNGSGMAAVGTMPMDFFHGGAENDDDYMGAGGYDDYDDGGDPADTMDPIRQAEAQILASFERAELARVSGALTAVSNGRPSSHNHHNNHNGSINEWTDVEPLMLAKVLQAPQAALPSQVDVVKLRQAMWLSVSNAMESNPTIQQQQQQNQEEEEGQRQQQQQQTPARRKRGREEEEEEEETHMAGEGSEELPRFSEVVLPILPQIPGISATGTLSPAFFFFSILFLANEHGVLLESVPELDDLVVRGVKTA